MGYVDVVENHIEKELMLKEMVARNSKEGEVRICGRCKSPYLIHSTYKNPDSCIICSNERMSTVNKEMYKEMSRSKGWYKKK
jgi:hypothetical protein